MKQDESNLLSDCEFTSNINSKSNKSVKRKFPKINGINIDNASINRKKKKFDKHSEEAINSAVDTTTNRYMTRNRLKNELTESNEFEKSTTKDKFTENSTTKDKLTENSEPKKRSGKRIRATKSEIEQKKLNLGFIFTHDIIFEKSFLGITQNRTKSTPLLFESDSESEIERRHLYNSVKIEAREENPMKNSELDCTPVFDKNVHVKKYFNKKMCSVYNMSHGTTSIKLEESNHNNISPTFSSQSLNYYGFDVDEEITQNETKCYELPKISGPTISVDDNINDKSTNVTEFIRDLEVELQRENKFLPGIFNNQGVSYDHSVSNIGRNSENEINSDKYEEISFDFKSIFNNQEISHNYNVSVEYNSENEINSYKQEEISLDFESISRDQDTFNDTNNLQFSISNTEHQLDTEINSSNSKILSLDYNSISRDQDTFNDTDNVKFSISNAEHQLDTAINSSNSKILSLDYNNLERNSKCQCEIFYSFNKDANKILTSKTNHFVFNINAKNVRQKLFHQKHVEANILKMLITEEKKYIAQSEMCFTTNSIPMKNITFEKSININDNHIEPRILNMLKDVYVGIEYLPEFCDFNDDDNKSPELPNNNKVNVQTSIQKPTDNKNKSDISNITFNIKLPVENLVDSGQNIINDNVIKSNIITNNKNHDEKLLNFDGNDITNNMFISNSPRNKKLFNNKRFSKNKIVDNNTLSCITKNNYHLKENSIDLSKNYISDEVILSNNTPNNKILDENHQSFDKNKITDNVFLSNIISNKIPCNKNQFNFDKNEIPDQITIPCVKKNKKNHYENSDHFDKDKIAHKITVSKITTNNKSHGENHISFDENKIADAIAITSSITSNEKPYEETRVNFVENKISGKITIPCTTKNKRFPRENSVNVGKDKIAQNVNVSNNTTCNNTVNGEYDIANNINTSNVVSFEKCDEKKDNSVKNKIADKIIVPCSRKNEKLTKKNCVNVDKNEITHENIVSKITTNNKIQVDNHLYFGENKISDKINISCTAKNKKIPKENSVNVGKDEIAQNVNVSNITMCNNTVNGEYDIANNINTSNVVSIEKCEEKKDNSVKNKIADKIIVPCSTKKENLTKNNFVNVDKNEITHEVNVSKITTNNKIQDDNHLYFGENKSFDNTVTSNIKSNNKQNDEEQVNYVENKIADKIIVPCSTKKENHTKNNFVNVDKNEITHEVNVSKITTNNKIQDDNHLYFGENKSFDNTVTSNIKSNNKLNDEEQVNYVENKIADKINVPCSTKKENLTKNNFVNVDKNEITHEVNVSKITTNNKIQDDNHLYFGENKSFDNTVTSNIKSNNKLNDEEQVNYVENKIADKIVVPCSTKNENLTKKNCVNVDKNEITREVILSKITTNNKIQGDNHLYFAENKSFDNTVTSNIKSNNKLNDEEQVNLVKNKFFDNITKNQNIPDKIKIDGNVIVSNITTNNEMHDKKHINFCKNKISDNVLSNITTNCIYLDENDVNSDSKNKINDSDDKTSNISKKVEPENLLPNNENCIGFDRALPNSIFDENNFNIYCDFKASEMNSSFDTKSKIKIEENSAYRSSDENCLLEVESKNCDTKIEKNPLHIYQPIKDTIVPLSNKICSPDENYMSQHINEPNNSLFDDAVGNTLNNSSSDDDENKLQIEDYDDNFVSEVNTNTTLVNSLNDNTENSTITDKNNKGIEFSENELIHSKSVEFSENELIHSKSIEFSENELIHSKSVEFSENELIHSKSIEFSENELIHSKSIEYSENELTHSKSIEFSENELIHSKSIEFSENELIHSKSIEFSENELIHSKSIEFSENKLHSNSKPSTEVSTTYNDIAFKTILPKEPDLSNINKNENSSISKTEKYSFTDCMTKEMCDDLYKKKLLNDDIANKNEYFPKYIQDILKEIYVDDIFVTVCEHMIESCDEGEVFPELNQSIQTNPETFSNCNMNNSYQENNKPSTLCNKTKNVDSKQNESNGSEVFPELNQSIQTNSETFPNCNMNTSYQENNKPSTLCNKTKNVNSKQDPSAIKSNMKIRHYFRDFLKSNESIDTILESRDFRSLRFFKEEEIACTIGVFLFEQTIEQPIITGLLFYKKNLDSLNGEEKIRELDNLRGIPLCISCPNIIRLTNITVSLVKMLRSNTLIELILNVIRKNILNKQMNTNHAIDNHLITQTTYYVAICMRLRLLKSLQTFIFDSMVLIPNKYCCVIFISLLLWKNCLPIRTNNEQDPAIITVLSHLIAKKKFYSEQNAGCDIFQRELINLLSVHFNYSFSTDLPVNFIQHVHKPDFFVSVVMFIKCCHLKDLTEFMVNCLFPIIEDYLDTQQNANNALKTMESIIIAVKPFKITCNATIATYLKKSRGSIYGPKNDVKEHAYNITYNNYKAMQNKFIEYLHDCRSRSQAFEESLVSSIMVLGSVDYLASCVSLMKWKPKYEPSTILLKKIDMFKSIIGHNLWNKLCLMEDHNLIKCLVNSCLLKKDAYCTIVRLHALR